MENDNVYGHMRRWKRAKITLSAGKPFFLQEQAESEALRRTKGQMMRDGTNQIVESLARLLPESYQGMYKSG
jgi:hypothetical protein